MPRTVNSAVLFGTNVSNSVFVIASHGTPVPTPPRVMLMALLTFTPKAFVPYTLIVFMPTLSGITGVRQCWAALNFTTALVAAFEAHIPPTMCGLLVPATRRDFMSYVTDDTVVVIARPGVPVPPPPRSTWIVSNAFNPYMLVPYTVIWFIPTFRATNTENQLFVS